MLRGGAAAWRRPLSVAAPELKAGAGRISFGQLGLPLHVYDKLSSNVKFPSMVQIAATPVILRGADAVIQTSPGSGKTLAYLLPLIAGLDRRIALPQAVVIAPSRELVYQLRGVAVGLLSGGSKQARAHPLRVEVAVGNISDERIESLIEQPPQLIFGTPLAATRLLGRLNRGRVRSVVLDEADALLSNASLRSIISGGLLDRDGPVGVPRDAQIVTASAIMSDHVIAMIKQHMKRDIAGHVGAAVVTNGVLDRLERALADAEKTQDLTVLPPAEIRRLAEAHVITVGDLEAEHRMRANIPSSLAPSIEHLILLVEGKSPRPPAKTTTTDADAESPSEPAADGTDAAPAPTEIVLSTPAKEHAKAPSPVAMAAAFSRWFAVARPQCVLVFCRDRLSAAHASQLLQDKGFDAPVIHNAVSAETRVRILRNIACRRLRVVITTDLLGLGIDLPALSHIFNWDAPAEWEQYVHRAGRVGRLDTLARRHGVVVTPVARGSRELETMERVIGRLGVKAKTVSVKSGAMTEQPPFGRA